ncbi:hypothetical protein L484_019241 [Morus notabilis]|uniref:Uncharacterized protein n=1 Tax=Morus notabilis TaxID=981085 RepID=W9QRC1_9ROSA|nr:hypothetical protein L484_019241 [Morus notabilis]
MEKSCDGSPYKRKVTSNRYNVLNWWEDEGEESGVERSVESYWVDNGSVYENVPQTKSYRNCRAHSELTRAIKPSERDKAL